MRRGRGRGRGTSILRATRCGMPLAMRMEAATRDIMALRGRVTMGTPAHSTSVALVCALTRGVSMNRSASLARCMYLRHTGCSNHAKCGLILENIGQEGAITRPYASDPKTRRATRSDHGPAPRP
jgi:hypothetical protein